MRPMPRTPKECELSSTLLLHNFHTKDCPAALLGGDVSSACYVQ